MSHFVLNKGASRGERIKSPLHEERRIDGKVVHIFVFGTAITVQISGPLRAQFIVIANIVTAIAELMRCIPHL
jgi:hypothetical protein